MAEEKNGNWKAPQIRGLRQRWLVNTILPVLILLALIVTLFSAGISNYYYRSMEDGMEQRGPGAGHLL